MIKKIKSLVWFGLVLALGLAVGAYHSNQLFSNRQEINASGVLEEIRNLSQLNTVEMYFNEIVDFQDAKYFHDLKIPFTEKTFIFKAKARVRAGMDLSLILEDDIQIHERSIVLRLPPPEITSVEVLEYQAYHEKDGLFNEVTNEDTLSVLQSFQEDLRKQAEAAGILDHAQTHGLILVRNLLEILGFEKIEILQS